MCYCVGDPEVAFLVEEEVMGVFEDQLVATPGPDQRAVWAVNLDLGIAIVRRPNVAVGIDSERGHVVPYEVRGFLGPSFDDPIAVSGADAGPVGKWAVLHWWRLLPRRLGGGKRRQSYCNR